MCAVCSKVCKVSHVLNCEAKSNLLPTMFAPPRRGAAAGGSSASPEGSRGSRYADIHGNHKRHQQQQQQQQQQSKRKQQGQSIRKQRHHRPQLSLSQALQLYPQCFEATKVNVVSKYVTQVDPIPAVYHRAPQVFLSHNSIATLRGIRQFVGVRSLALADNVVKCFLPRPPPA